MSLADELTKLEELRRSGALTDAEFGQAKAALLAAPAGNGATDNLAAQLGEVRFQNELARVDREWGIEKEKYKLTGRYGARYLPTKGMGVASVAVGCGFGVFWIAMSSLLFAEMREEHGPPAGLMASFVLIGVAVIGGLIWYGIHVIRKAEAYGKARAAYRARRVAVKPEDFR